MSCRYSSYIPVASALHPGSTCGHDATVPTTRRKTAARKPAKRRPGKLAPAARTRGLSAAQVVLSLEDPGLADLIRQVGAAGGAPIGAYGEPLPGHPLLLATLPFAAIRPTPFQCDLSPTQGDLAWVAAGAESAD